MKAMKVRGMKNLFRVHVLHFPWNVCSRLLQGDPQWIQHSQDSHKIR